MPELPEVEFARTLLEAHAVGRTVQRVYCADDNIVFAGCSPQECARTLQGARIAGAGRRGKQLWLALDRRRAVLLHFGMTGRIVVAGTPTLPLAKTPDVDDSAWPPRFTKIELQLHDGGRLAFTNARRLGRVRLRVDPRNEPPICELGFDPLLDPPTPATFATLLGARRGNIKGLLLNQSFAAGVGNWIADEVLFAARLSPKRTAASLSPAEARALLTALRDVVARAVAVNADATRFPKHWLFHRRWGPARGGVTTRGEAIVMETVAGRSTAWVPARQV